MHRFTFTLLACLSLALTHTTPRAEADEEAPTTQAQLAESRVAWEDASESCGGNYEYNVTRHFMMGNGHETTIVVRNHQVTERHYRAWPAPGQNAAPEQADAGEVEWTETDDDIGSHDEGAEPLTMEALYDMAEDIASRELGPFERLCFRTNDDGLMLSCFIINTMIADDAPLNGVSLSDITLQSSEE